MLHGIPSFIINDRIPFLMSLSWKVLFKLQGTILNRVLPILQSLKDKLTFEIGL